MQHKSFAHMPCPIARSLEQVGEWWSMLILRDAFSGKTRFDEFAQSLGIAPTMLTRRLAQLVAAGMLEKRLYSERPPRHEYLLTERGRDFRMVLVALFAFGDKHFAFGGGRGKRIVDAKTGKPVEPMLVDKRSGRPLIEPEFVMVRGRRTGTAARATKATRAEIAAALEGAQRPQRAGLLQATRP